jgi:hypothetical protein
MEALPSHREGLIAEDLGVPPPQLCRTGRRVHNEFGQDGENEDLLRPR